MTQQINLGQPAPSEGGSPIPTLAGSIGMTSGGGSLAWYKVGQSPAQVEWVQGSPPMAEAQFSLQRADHFPSPPPPPQTTELTVGKNSISFPGDWDSAQLVWAYSGGMGGPGAATLSSNMGGLPVGASGWNTISEVIGPQEANFQIAFAAEPTSCLLLLDVESTPATVRPILVRVCVDGVYAAALADGCQILIKGKVVTLGLDIRPDNVTDVMVQFSLQYQ